MRELIQAEQALGDYTRKHARHIIAGVLGNNAGTVDHATRTNFVYVRLHGDANQVIEAEAIASFPHTAGIVVAVELVKRNAASRYQVLGIASNILFVGSPWAGTVGEHAAQHQRRDLGEGGFDPLDIYNRALVNLRGRAQAAPNMTVYVERGFYFIGGTLYEWTGGNSAAFTVPAGSFGVTVRRCDLLYIGSDQALHIVQGATTSDGSVPPYPTTPYPCIPVAYVYLASSTASIQESNIKDARVILTASDGTPVAHNLLSATHGDTLAAAVVAGDIIIGNDTPKWSRLAITVPAANVRNVVGVDNGETKPAWKVALDATNPVTLTVSTAAAPGTSLVFAHRDHAHAITSSSNPGATEAILATNNLGALYLAVLVCPYVNIQGASGNTNGFVLSNDPTIQAVPHKVILQPTSAALTNDYTVTYQGITGIATLGAGTLGVSSTNNVALADHVHAITSSSNPGAAAAILATDASGYLTIVKLTTTADVHPDSDVRGIMARVVNRQGVTQYTDHFRSGSIPTNFTWQGAPFGTPNGITYNLDGDYLGTYITAGTQRAFLSKAITNSAAAWQNKRMTARCRASAQSYSGVRVDDGTDDNYAELYMYANNNGTQTVHYKTRAGGGVASDTATSLTIPVTDYVVLDLYVSYANPNYTAIFYVTGEEGEGTSLGTASITAWVPAAGRAGVIATQATTYDYALADWLLDLFG